jgi:hypothetical protein
MKKHRHSFLTYHVVTALPALSIEGAMGFCEEVYRELEKVTDSAPGPEETEYNQERQIFSVARAVLLQETEEDALKEYTMDDVVEGQISLSTKILPCSYVLQQSS